MNYGRRLFVHDEILRLRLQNGKRLTASRGHYAMLSRGEVSGRLYTACFFFSEILRGPSQNGERGVCVNLVMLSLSEVSGRRD
jgi:hypothetical protein